MAHLAPFHTFVSRIGAAHSGGEQGQDVFRRYHADRTPGICWEDFALELPRGRFPWRQMRTYMRLRNGQLSGVTDEAIARFDEQLQRTKPAQVVLGSSLFGPLAERARAHGCRVVVHSHNCEFDYFAGEAAMRGHLSGELVRAAFRAERSCVRAAHLLIALTAYDAGRFEHLYGSSCPVVVANPFIVSLMQRLTNQWPWQGAAPRTGVVFVGSGSSQNLLAAEHLLATWTSELPPLRIIGATGSALVKRHGQEALRRKGIIATGFLHSLDDALRSAEFMLCPMTLGSGVKVKAIDALANGCRVLASRETMNGFNFAVDSGLVLPLDMSRPGDSIERARRHTVDPIAFKLALQATAARQAADLDAALGALSIAS